MLKYAEELVPLLNFPDAANFVNTSNNFSNGIPAPSSSTPTSCVSLLKNISNLSNLNMIITIINIVKQLILI